MSTRPFHGIRTAIVALATLATTVPLLRAQTAEQTYLNSLLAPKTIVTASAKALATAVSTGITSNTNGFTAADLATAAFTPLAGKVRADRNTSAPSVVEAAIAALSGTGVTFNSDVATLVDDVVDVNAGNTKEDLTTAGQTAVVKAALGTLSDESLEATDQNIGAKLVADSTLEGLADGALSKILDGGIAGINGTKGKSTGVAPEAAQDFITGIVQSGTLPDVNVAPTAADYGSFAVAILKSVSANTSVDEAGAYAVATKEGSANQANLVTLATSLFAKYIPAEAKITQGIAASIPLTSSSTDTARATFFGSLTTAAFKDAVAIDQGATFVDPYKADSFTSSVFTSLVAAPNGVKLLQGDAAKVATAVGETLGANGDELTDVAVTYMTFIDNGDLPASSAASYATAMVNGAINGLPKNSILTYSTAAVGIGGKLDQGKPNITTSINQATVDDLASVVDTLATAVIDSTGNTQAKIASYIGSLVKGIAGVTKNQVISDNNTVDATSYLAGSLASTVAALLAVSNAAEQTAIDSAIASSLKMVVNKTVYDGGNAADPTAGSVLAEINSPTFAQQGAISFAETAVTNL